MLAEYSDQFIETTHLTWAEIDDRVWTSFYVSPM
jgi:hypothetical protein